MEIKLFGKNLFSFSKKEAYFAPAYNQVKDSKYLIDFIADTGGLSGSWGELDTTFMQIPNGVIASSGTNTLSNTITLAKSTPKSEIKEEDKLTPKGVFNLKLLNDESFVLKTDPTYVEEQLNTFKDKLSLIKSEEYDMARGTREIASIVSRMENRKKYPDFKDFYEEYPYTTTGKIEDLVKAHSYLKLGQVAQFVADMPKDAVETMKNYNKNTDKLCGKQAVFYIIADKKDFEKSNKRRDPILLAQSPFGHFWQILGAWDKEMMFLGEL